MKLVVDMNLSPRWVEAIRSAGMEAVHWSSIGSPSATDAVVLAWAVANERVLFTHDLDFSAILAASGDSRPSVIQLRTEDLDPEAMLEKLVETLTLYGDEISQGAIVTIDPARSRIRILPIRSR